jgi:hypothetical protein
MAEKEKKTAYLSNRRRRRTSLAGVAVLALDEPPPAAGEHGLPHAHRRHGHHLRRVDLPPAQLHHLDPPRQSVEWRGRELLEELSQEQQHTTQQAPTQAGSDERGGQELLRGRCVLCRAILSTRFCSFLGRGAGERQKWRRRGGVTKVAPGWGTEDRVSGRVILVSRGRCCSVARFQDALVW